MVIRSITVFFFHVKTVELQFEKIVHSKYSYQSVQPCGLIRDFTGYSTTQHALFFQPQSIASIQSDQFLLGHISR